MINISKYTNAYISASLIYIIANGLGQGTTLLSNIFFTRYMSQADYGLYSNYYSYVALLVPFVGMNLYFGLTNAYIDFKEEIHKLRSSVLLLSIAGFFITLMVVFFLKSSVGLSLPYICIILAISHAYGFFVVNFFIQSMNMENRFVAKGVMLSLPNILQALVAGIFVINCNDYISRAVGSTLGVGICGVVGVIIIFKTSAPSVNFQYWKYVLRISLPAILGSVAAMIMQQCDKVMITSMVGPEETAVYALVFNIGYILCAVQQATGGVWQVWLYNTLSTKQYGNIYNVQKHYTFFMLTLATVLYMLSPELIKILAPSDYWQFNYITPFIIGSFVMIMYSMEMGFIEYEKKTHISSLIVICASVINMCLNYILIPQFGGLGAAYASVIGYLTIFLLSAFYVYRFQTHYLSLALQLKGFGIVCVLGVVFLHISGSLLLRYSLFGILFIIEVIYLYFIRNEIRTLFRN